MENVIKISIGSWAFTLQESACHYLDNRFKKYRESLEGNAQQEELVRQAEECLGAWLSHRVKSVSQVIDIVMLKQAFKECGLEAADGETQGSADGEPRESDGRASFSAGSGEHGGKGPEGERRRLFRDMDDKRLGGVLSGLAAWMGVSVTLLRVVFAALLCFSIFGSHGLHGHFLHSIFGTEIILYVILWICIPEGKLSQKATQKVADEPEMREPVGSAMGRMVRFAFGCLFLMLGICGLLFLPISAFCFPARLLSMLGSLPFPGHPVLLKFLLLTAFVIPQLFFIYEGAKLLFALHFRKLHIGPVLVCLWVVNVFVMGCVLAGNQLVIPVETSSAWNRMDLQGDTLHIRTVAPGWDASKTYGVSMGDDELSFLWQSESRTMFVLPVIDVDRDDHGAGYRVECKSMGTLFEDGWFDDTEVVSFAGDTLTLRARRFDRETPWYIDRMKMDIDVPKGTVVVVYEPDGRKTVVRKDDYIPFVNRRRHHRFPVYMTEYGH